MRIKEIQKLLNPKFGFTLLVDGIVGKYTKLALRLAGREMYISQPYYKKDGKLVISPALQYQLQKDKIWIPEAMENIEVADYTSMNLDKAEKVVKWLKNKKATCPFNTSFIINLYKLGHIFNISPTHCLANLCIESAYGTSRIARRYKNLFGMGITDNPKNRTYYKYLSYEASAVDWFKLIQRYRARGQDTEQKFNISARRHKAEWFNLESIKGFQNYATSQSKSMVCGLLVREIREVING